MEKSKNIEKILEEIKKKPIIDMTNEELKFIIENDTNLIAYERIDYTSELLKRTLVGVR